MGVQVIAQPDGEKLAVFCTETDRWQAWDLTPAQVKEWFGEHGGTGTRYGAGHVIATVRVGEQEDLYGRRGALTFAEANARAQYSGGEVLDGPVCPALLAVLRGPLDADA
jgi:hypothetical protein